MGDKPINPLDSTQASPHGGSSHRRLAPGTMVARYQIGEPLGEGGMGVVYRAQDQKLGRAVAIKFLASDNGEQARARFLREARAASALDHPNIGTVYEIGEADGLPFIVMALYEGETLRERIKKGPLPVEELVPIAQQLCRALSAAHQAGIVHRDLKPANIMLLPDGTLKLLDFGLARLTSIDESSLTHDGTILGTLGYMAPEQLRSAAVDARADLWALGAVLYEMLSQKPAFGGGPAATVVTRILTEDPAPLPDDAPPDLRSVCRRLLSKDAARRLGSASAVHDLLARRASPTAGRQGFLVGIGVTAVAAAFGVVVMTRPPPPPKPEPTVAALVLLQSPQPSPDAETLRLTKLGEQSEAVTRGIYDRATRDFKEGHFREAASGFQAAFELSGEASLLYNIAQSYRSAGDRRRATEFYRQFLRAVPKGPLTSDVEHSLADLSAPAPPPTRPIPEAQRKAQIAFNLGRFEEAATGFESAYLKSGDPELLLLLGETYLNAGNKMKGLYHLKRYLSEGGKDPAAQRLISQIEGELRPSPAAKAAPPEPEDLQNERRRLEAERKKLEQRLVEIDRAQKAAAPVDRAQAVQLYRQGRSEFDHGDYLKAAESFEACYRSSKEPGVLYNAAQSYRLAKQYKRARSLYAVFLQTHPSDELKKEVQKVLVDMPP